VSPRGGERDQRRVREVVIAQQAQLALQQRPLRGLARRRAEDPQRQHAPVAQEPGELLPELVMGALGERVGVDPHRRVALDAVAPQARRLGDGQRLQRAPERLGALKAARDRGERQRALDPEPREVLQVHVRALL
jgi:hypothetical protein